MAEEDPGVAYTEDDYRNSSTYENAVEYRMSVV